MSDTNILSYKGNFFLPDNPKDLIIGILTVDSDGVGHLDLLGAFDADTFLSSRKMCTIWGVLFNGDKVSLIDSYRGKSVYRSAGSEVSYNIGTTVVGTHIVDREEAVFTVISSEIDHLQEWLGIDGGKLGFSLDFKTITYNYQRPDDIVFNISDDITGTIYFRNEFWDGLDYGNEFHQRVRLELKSAEKKSANHLIRSMLSFRQLLSIFVGQQVNVIRIVMTCPDEKTDIIKPTPSREAPLKEISVYFKSGQRLTPLPERPIVFVTYQDVAQQFQEIVRNWYQLLATELRPIIFILLEALTDYSTFEEADFLRAWQGVEAFHRLILQDTSALKDAFNIKMKRINEALSFDDELKEWVRQATAFAYEPPAKERLRAIIRQYQHLLPRDITEETIMIWVREMGNTRNYLTHFDPAGKKKKVSGRKLYQYTTLLNWLLLILILTRLSVNEELLKNLCKHQHLYLEDLLKETAPNK